LADDSNLTVKIVLDDGSIATGFAKIEKQAKDTAEKTGSHFSELGDEIAKELPSSISEGIKAIGPVIGGVLLGIGAIGIALKEAFDLSVEGEKLKAVDLQFNALAAGAGIIGEDLKAGLEKAAGGLVSTDNLLQIANKSMINLGSSAARLPEVLDLARTATLALGGSIEDRFAAISSAIETGNTRALKSAGIIVDADKAYKDYAETLNVSVGSLSQAQKQQAVLNAVLEQGREKFKNVSKDVQPIQTNMQLLSVAIQDTKENFASLINGSIGAGLAKLAGAAASAVSAFTNLTSGKTDLTAGTQEQANTFKETVGFLNTRLEKYRSELALSEAAGNTAFSDQIRSNIKLTEARMFDLNFEIAQIEGQYKNAAIASDESTAKQVENASKIAELTVQQVAEREQANQKIQADQIQAQLEFTAAQEQKIGLIQNYADQASMTQAVARQNELLLNEQFNLQSQQLDQKFIDDESMTADQYAQAQVNLEIQKQSKLTSLATSTASKLKAIEDASFKQRIAGFSSFFGNLATLSDSGSKELAAIGKAAALAQATIDGYAAVVGAYKNGASIGGPALGAAFAAAAGIATAVQIAKIASAGGPGGSSGGGATYSPDAGGGGGVTPSLQPTPAAQLNQSAASVSVNVQGNILNNKDSALYIADILNEQFKSGGVIFGAT
jgi:hypothetical protein